MSSTQSNADYFCDQLSTLGEIKAKKMFGEYGVYANGLYFALICDNKLFFKVKKWKVADVLEIFGNQSEPYPGAKGCCQVPFEMIEDKDRLTEIAKLVIDKL